MKLLKGKRLDPMLPLTTGEGDRSRASVGVSISSASGTPLAGRCAFGQFNQWVAPGAGLRESGFQDADEMDLIDPS